MKKQIYTFIGLVIILTISAVTAIHAQSATNIKAQIPFEFSVKNKTFPAGDYTLQKQDNRGEMWTLRSRDNERQVNLPVMNIETKRFSDGGKLTFHRCGDKYFLSAMEMPDYKIELPESSVERALEKSLKQNNRLAKNTPLQAVSEKQEVSILFSRW